MRKHRFTTTLLLCSAASLVTAFALADEHGDRGHDRGERRGLPGAPAASGAASGAPSGAPASSAAAKDDDDDPAAAPDESKEDKEKRRNYIRRAKRQMEDTLHASSRDLNADERAAIKHHWRVSMRLWRVRHMAQQSGDKATVARVDALLAKADAKTTAKLNELSARSASTPAASSSAGAK